MKRKVLALMLITVLGLSGCGSVEEKPGEPLVEESKEDYGQEESESASGQEETEQFPSGDAVGEDVGTESEGTEGDEGSGATEQAPEITEPLTSIEYLDVTLNYHYDSFYDEASMMYGHYNTINLHTDAYPALTEAVNAYNQAYATAMQKYLDELEQWAVEEYKEYGAGEFRGPYVCEEDMFICRADNQVLSIMESGYDYAGGAHGLSYFNGVSFDVQTGEQIELESIVKDMDSLPDILGKELEEKYPDVNFWTDPLADTLQEYITPTDPEYAYEFTWTLDYEGVTFYFGSYELASYADGVHQATVSYSEYPQLFEEKYFENAATDYVLELNDFWWGSDVDLDGDGVTDYISVRQNYVSDPYMSDSYEVTVNGNTFTQDIYSFDLDTFLVKSGGKNYLYVQHTVENDYKYVSVYEITKNSVEYLDNFSGGLGSFTNSLDFQVIKRLDLLSTYGAIVGCHVGEDGMPVENEGAYQIINELAITSTVDISAELVDESGNLLGTTYTFPAGTDFQFMTTDGETYVDMLAEDGQYCRFYTTEQWPQTVNGMDAVSSFEMLFYAG